jgi:hypothetical protein
MDNKTELNFIKLIIITIGSALLLMGFLLLVEFKLHTGFVFVLLPIIICNFVFYLGWKLQNKFLLAAGSLIFFIGFSSLFVISNLMSREVFGIICVLLSFALAIYFVLEYLIFKKVIFWLFNPIIVFLFLGIVFIKGNYSFLHFTFYIGLAIGIALFGSGLYWRLFGLIIPGCLLIGISPGLFFAWGNSNLDNGLVQTGIFLVCFALGWGLITVFSKMQTQSFLWWPLIPGGILAMVGWGLYIGGNPKNAVGFIGNTGSIGLLIFGIYILLMKRGIQR